MHYYFNELSSKPQHHRFDRGSYIYLFHNAAQQKVKLEIANHAGTPDQDAFFGYLDVASLRYSYNQPALFTLLINTSALTDTSQWHLPAYNEKNETKYLYKLHAVDLYLWTEKTAATLLGHLKKVLRQDRLDLRDVPASRSSHSEHRDSMSPVVQQLERTAIGANVPPRADSTVSAQSVPSTVSARSSSQATPGGYNPAAPAAPEPIAPREKTPPPPDAATGTGLTEAAKYDQVPPPNQFSPPPNTHHSQGQTPSQAPYFAGPPQQARQPSFPGPPSGPQRTYSGGVSPPAPNQPQQHSAPSFGPLAQSTIPSSSPPGQQPFQPQYASYPIQTQNSNYPGSPGFNPQLPPTPSAPPAYNEQFPIQSPGFPPPPPGFQQPAQPPVGGYSNYNYSTGQRQQSGDLNNYGAYTGDMHQQLYRPTADEVGRVPSQSTVPSRQKTSQTATNDGKPANLQDSAARLEGKVSKYLNRLDKLW